MVIKKIDLKLRNELIPQLTGKCQGANLIRIGYDSGGTIGWIGGYYILELLKKKKNIYFHLNFNLKNVI